MYALLGLAVIIALINIANSMALSIHERTRELGLLRAVGMTRHQTCAAIAWESVLIGCSAPDWASSSASSSAGRSASPSATPASARSRCRFNRLPSSPSPPCSAACWPLPVRHGEQPASMSYGPSQPNRSVIS